MYGLFFFILGIAVAGVFNDIISVIVICMGIIAFLISGRRKINFKKIVICILVFVIGCTYYYFNDNFFVTKHKNINDKDVYITVTVLTEPEYNKNFLSFTGELKEYGKNAKITLNDTPYISAYDKILFKATVTSITNNCESNYANNIYYNVVSNDKNYKIEEGKGFMKTLSNLKNKIIYILENNFSSDAAMFLKGILLGDNSLRTDEFDNALRRTGLSHVVSVSGMHFSTITMALLYILRRMRLGRKSASLVTVPIAFLLALFIGLTPSVIRSFIMIAVLSIADIVNRDRVTDIHLVLVTAVIMLIVNVYYIHSVAFVLSFMSVAGIILLSGPIKAKIHMISSNLADIISATVSATVFTLPFVVYYFKGIPILTIFSNLIITPLISFIMIYGIIIILLSFVYMKIGYYIGIPLDIIVSLCVKVINFIGVLPFGYFETLYIDVYLVCIFYLGVFLVYCKLPVLPKIIMLSTIFIYFTLSLFIPVNRFIDFNSYLYVMNGADGGKGIITVKDKNLFINVSTKNGDYNFDLIEKECNGYFDVYVASNYQSLKYIESNKINIGTLYIPSGYINSEYYRNIIDEYSKEIVVVDEKMIINYYDFNLTLIPKDSYNISIVILDNKSKNIIFTNRMIEEFNYNSEYIITHEMLYEYSSDNILNNKTNSVERIRL